MINFNSVISLSGETFHGVHALKCYGKRVFTREDIEKLSSHTVTSKHLFGIFLVSTHFLQCDSNDWTILDCRASFHQTWIYCDEIYFEISQILSWFTSRFGYGSLEIRFPNSEIYRDRSHIWWEFQTQIKILRYTQHRDAKSALENSCSTNIRKRFLAVRFTVHWDFQT